ncbi:MAG: dienelactone hydrolase family protein [Chloroflexi bacterium]|nr:dienelactone hydrolase family protein [Chloroflexota bacterium]
MVNPENEEAFRIALDGDQSVTAVRVRPSTKSTGWTFIYAPGAGSNINDSFGRWLSEAFAARGIETVRFQFPYVEARRRFPDRPPVLEATWEAAIRQVRDQDRLAVGGRSMGGRIASQVAARGVNVDALVLFAYPLHPPDQPDNLRTKHLADIKVPTLFCSGTADKFGTVDELRAAVALVPGALFHLLEAVDHGYGPAKGSGRARREIYAEATAAAIDFLAGIGPLAP